ncbi:MAG: hypothetical protein NT157_05755 [Candidatus Micrarchaeota archaeon]|nr:hypothetical protein [Candidatus Micrarchaeota archaeon]
MKGALALREKADKHASRSLGVVQRPRSREPLAEKAAGGNGHSGIGGREMMERNAERQMLRDQGYNGPIYEVNEVTITFRAGRNGNNSKPNGNSSVGLDRPTLMAREVEMREKATRTGHHD